MERWICVVVLVVLGACNNRVPDTEERVARTMPAADITALPAIAPIPYSMPGPRYPDPSSCVEGIVSLCVLVDTAGAVTDVKLVEGFSRPFDSTTIEAVRTWRYHPGQLPQGNRYRTASLWIPVRFAWTLD